jgi:NAD(P)-dependent dehydrogenase (short-subunit alcohol dehydrogenase family)
VAAGAVSDAPTWVKGADHGGSQRAAGNQVFEFHGIDWVLEYWVIEAGWELIPADQPTRPLASQKSSFPPRHLTATDRAPRSGMHRTILVIGGNSGIGLATVSLLQSQGNHLIAAARSPEALAGLGIPTQPFDATAPEALELPAVLDGLIYFPGSITLKPFHRLTAGDFLNDFQINCLGAASAIQNALPALKAAPAASIVLFSTVAVDQGMAFHASVAAAKGAVEGLALSLAAELAPKIRVNVIAPSLTDTPLASAFLNSDAKREGAGKRHPLQQVGDAADVAALAAFLLSDASKFMTGQILRPDGGLSSVRTF